MLQFVRSGPKIIMLEPTDFDMFDNFIKGLSFFRREFDVSINDDFRERGIFGQLDKDSTLVYTVNHLTDDSVETGFGKAYIIDERIENIMMKIINYREQLVKRIRLTPQLIMMRIVGNDEKVVSRLIKDFEGELVEFSEVLKGKSKGAYICLTHEDIDHRLNHKAFLTHTIYADRDFSQVLSYLERYSLKYVNIGLENKEWYELNIKIYDSSELFKEQYDRLVYIIDQLNLGLIAGESWATDAALVFKSVGVYKVKLFTYYPPSKIKKILVGLEYTADGKRLVDFDLYHRRKKIYWDTLKTNEIYKKEPVGIDSRKYLESKLTEEQLNHLLMLESRLGK